MATRRISYSILRRRIHSSADASSSRHSTAVSSRTYIRLPPLHLGFLVHVFYTCLPSQCGCINDFTGTRKALLAASAWHGICILGRLFPTISR